MSAKVIVETDRLLLREFVEDDLDAYFALGSDPVVTRYTGVGPFESRDQALEILRTRPIADYRKHNYGRWACVLKEDGVVTGFVGLKWLEELGEVDIGYWLLPVYWGRGIATEAGSATLDYGFGPLGLTSIIGLVHPENLASARVLEKLGMTRTGIIDYWGKPTIRFESRANQVPRSEP